jgi:hypothetical protein
VARCAQPACSDAPPVERTRHGQCRPEVQLTDLTVLQEEMLGRVQEGEWAVLVMDPQSTRIMSAACRISEILNYGVARESMLFTVHQ